MAFHAPPQVMIRLAQEGVPVAVIARACTSPLDEVMKLFRAALDGGQLVSLPRYDWHPHPKGERGPLAAKTEEEIALACRRIFGLTRLRASFLSALVRRSEVPKAVLHQIIVNLNPKRDKEQNIKMVDVVIYHLRKKLEPHGLEIKTLHSSGYYMEPAMRKRAQELLGDGQGGKKTGGEAEAAVPAD